jgi:hypothetical protein
MSAALPLVSAVFTIGGVLLFVLPLRGAEPDALRSWLRRLLAALLLSPLAVYALLSVVVGRFGWPRNFFYLVFPIFVLQAAAFERLVPSAVVRRIALAAYAAWLLAYGLPPSLAAWTRYGVERGLLRVAVARPEDAVVLPYLTESDAVIAYDRAAAAAGRARTPTIASVPPDGDPFRMVPSAGTLAVIARADGPQAPGLLLGRLRLVSSEPLDVGCFSYYGLSSCADGVQRFLVHAYAPVR